MQVCGALEQLHSLNRFTFFLVLTAKFLVTELKVVHRYFEFISINPAVP